MSKGFLEELNWVDSSTEPSWVRFNYSFFSSGHSISRYELKAKQGAASARAPVAWELQGSNDNKAWGVLDRQTGMSPWKSGELRAFTLSRPTPYLWYRICFERHPSHLGIELAHLCLYVATGTRNVSYNRIALKKMTLAKDNVSSVLPPFYPQGFIETTQALPVAIVAELPAMHAFVVQGYMLQSDYWGSYERMPKAWRLYGSQDGSAWDLLDTRQDQVDWRRLEARLYCVPAPKAYHLFRMEVLAVNTDSGVLRIGDWVLFRRPNP